MKPVVNFILLAGLTSGLLACGEPTTQQKDIKSIASSKTQELSSDAVGSENKDNSLKFESTEISESAFAEKTAEGEQIFNEKTVRDALFPLPEAKSDTLAGETISSSEESTSESGAGDPKIAAKAPEPEATVQNDPPVSQDESKEPTSPEKSSENLALAQNEIESKIDGILPAGAPSFMKSKLKNDATSLLYCGKDCEDKAQKLMVTSYSVSRFLSSRGLALTDLDLNKAIAAAGKLLSDIALIVVEATSPNPDPTNIVLLVDIFITDLQELILSLI